MNTYFCAMVCSKHTHGCIYKAHLHACVSDMDDGGHAPYCMPVDLSGSTYAWLCALYAYMHGH